MTMTMTNTKRRLRSSQPRLSVEDRLLAAMERLIEQGHSFATLKVDELAKEAGIARATFYLHFADKSELVARLMTRLTQEVVGSAGDWFEAKGQSGPRTIKQALTGIITTFRKHHAILAAVTATAAHDATVARLHEEMMTKLCQHSRQAIAAVKGDMPEGDFPFDMLADVLTWSVEQYCARVVSRYDPRQMEALINTFSHICNSAIFLGEERSGTALTS